jgi:NAD(P)-dependent dehydrogenase (short-subunit alcohol dehydrogenase family)
MTDTVTALDDNLSLRVDGQSIIVTGAASGIGRRTAELFAEAGATVTACDINPIDPRTSHGDLRVRVGDVGDEGYISSVVADADSVSPLRAVVHCAGIFDGPGLDADLSLWKRIIDTNLTSSFLFLKHALPRIEAAGGGSIVLIGSVSGINGGYKSGPAYAASKAGVHGLVKWAARRYAPVGIRVNAVAPGSIRTPMNAAASTPTSLTPLGHLGETIDIARAALYLVSPIGAFVTGSIHVVDGGMTI